MKKPKRKLNTKAILILMLQRDTDRIALMNHFRVKRNAINMAISGQRPNLHFKILDYLRSL